MSDTMLSRFKRQFRLNMLISLIVTVTATCLIITGTYDGIETRQSSEFLLGWTAIAGLLYTVGFWFACYVQETVFSRCIRYR
jgi:hypothetical protein